MGDLVQEACQFVCSKLKPDIVSVIDSIAHPDSVIKSILGRSDGKVRCSCFGKKRKNLGFHFIIS